MGRLKLRFGAVLFVLSVLIIVALKKTKQKNIPNKEIISPPTNSVEIEKYILKQAELKSAMAIYFKKAITSKSIVGAGVSIVKGDSVLISEGYGIKSVDGSAKINNKTVFRLGSLSKGFTTVLASKLNDENIINWNDQIIKYIPEFQFGDSINSANIKVCHILSHTSGTPYHSYTNLVEAGLPMAKIAKKFHDVTPINPPGQQYSYQNAMFSMYQEVVLKATGKDVKALLRNKLFTPLEMSQVSMSHSNLLHSENIALPHVKRNGVWRSLKLKDRYYNAVTAGGINASSLDMAKWMHFLLGHKPEIMQKKVIQEVFNPFILLNNNNKYYQRWDGHIKSSYGFGWRIHEFTNNNKTTTIWHHGGSVNNYRNEIALFPDTDLGICVLLNGNSKLARTVIPDLQKIINRIYTD